MKITNFARILMIAGFLIVARPVVYAAVVHTNDGKIVKGTITEITDGTVWMETEGGEVVEYVGVDQKDVSKILNDDGSYFDYTAFARK